MMTRETVGDSVRAIRAKTAFEPQFGIILGTGLGQLAEQVKPEMTIPYESIPHFATPTVESHRGRLILGTLSGRPVAVMQGRFHYYEGYEAWQVAFPVRVLKELGAQTLIVSNAAGGLNPLFRPSDIAVITDHINLTGQNPLRGPNEDAFGPRFPDMYRCYDPDLIEIAMSTALKLGIRLQQGVYAWVTGPNLETAAEYRFLRTIGADLVGMSTVPEVIVARHASMKVLGFSVVTDMGLPDAMQPCSLTQVLAAAAAAEPRLTALVSETLKEM